MSNFDIMNHIKDLHLLDNIETNIGFDGGEYFMETSMMMSNSCGKRTINPDDFEFEKLELHSKGQMVEISKIDAELIAKHFGLIK